MCNLSPCQVGSEEYTYNPVVSGKAAEYHRPEY